MRKFEDYLKVILKHEGGLSNHSSDPGGITKYGISLRFLQANNIDINTDGRVDSKDIVSITIEEASDIYLKYFWNKMNLEPIRNDLLKLHLFDMGVNAGTKSAIKILQKMIGVTPDGVIGKMTLAAIDNYKGSIVADYASARLAYYHKLTIRNPKLKVFIKGWTNRVNGTRFI
jgi:lysozyme family protein